MVSMVVSESESDSVAPPSNDMEAFRELLRSSRNIIAIAGAGLSAASGIPTFRGAGGLWRKFDAMTLATPEAFNESPNRVWQFYHYRLVNSSMHEPCLFVQWTGLKCNCLSHSC
jgi:NAD-dependent deacetylase sirtuin 5